MTPFDNAPSRDAMAWPEAQIDETRIPLGRRNAEMLLKRRHQGGWYGHLPHYMPASLERAEGDELVLDLKGAGRERQYLADPSAGPGERQGEERLVRG
jgi:hypothetical protein